MAHDKVIEPPCINCQKKGVTCVESSTTRSTKCQFGNLGERNFSQANHKFPDTPRRLWRSIRNGGRFGFKAPVDEPPTSDATSGHSNSSGSRIRGVQQWTNTRIFWANTGAPIPPQGNPIGVSPEVPILVTRIDGILGKLKINLVVKDENDTYAQGSYELDGEELEITTPIQKRRIQTTSLSPVPVSTTIHEVLRSPQPPQPPIRSPTRPSTLVSTSTSIQLPMVSTSRDPMSPEPESIF
ncbi:hypothetical protein O181_052968 [Austropuccinia psidii MF-1]|uniref:Uncharacterized protein n=1 Tax=Austropuccinia psidii MF-1 TaxID=1389203 RepID=A0A9Q3E6I9_9BASI|nr:hypothetical protein [Austropuccinia psidii MF-1]